MALRGGGSNSSLAVGYTAVVSRATTAKEAVDAATTKVATEEAVKKKVIEEVVAKKATEEAAAKRKIVDEAVAKKKAIEEAAKKTESGAATVVSDPSLAPSARVKRAAVPSGSTPPTKQ
jgi:DNA-binding protein H-NS